MAWKISTILQFYCRTCQEEYQPKQKDTNKQDRIRKNDNNLSLANPASNLA